MVGLKSLAVGAAEGFGKFLARIGEVGAQGDAGEFETTACSDVLVSESPLCVCMCVCVFSLRRGIWPFGAKSVGRTRTGSARGDPRWQCASLS